MIRIYTDKLDFLETRSTGLDAREKEISARVASIVERVRSGGDVALVELTRELDGVELDLEELRVPASELAELGARAGESMRGLISRAATNIRRYHERQRDDGFEDRLPDGTLLGLRTRPLRTVGVYVPGGEAAYPSSVLMNVVPARIAGVERIVVCTPPGALERSAELAAALVELSLSEVYRIGGAHAIAAMAYGTETVPRVDKIVGPGNAYVAEAKRVVFGEVGIDAIAGPSEIVVLADSTASPEYVAADLLSQAEHGSGNERAILVTTSRELAEDVSVAIEAQLDSLPRRDAVREVLSRHGGAVVVESLREGAEVVDAIAPEHLEILTESPEDVATLVRNAGAVFLGEHSPVPVGDFYGGPNHVLPTGGTARFASPLGVYDFIKRTSILRYSEARLRRERGDIERFARAEGFEAHARAIAIRFESR